MTEKLFMSVTESASFSGLSKTCIRNLIYANELKYIRSGKKYLISRESILEYLDKLLGEEAKWQHFRLNDTTNLLNVFQFVMESVLTEWNYERKE